MDGSFTDTQETQAEAAARMGVAYLELGARARRRKIPRPPVGRRPDGEAVFTLPRYVWDVCARRKPGGGRPGVLPARFALLRDMEAPTGFDAEMLHPICRTFRVPRHRSRGRTTRGKWVVDREALIAAVRTFLTWETRTEAARRHGVPVKYMCWWLTAAKYEGCGPRHKGGRRYDPAVVDRVVAARKAKEASE